MFDGTGTGTIKMYPTNILISEGYFVTESSIGIKIPFESSVTFESLSGAFW
jgi:hypothetical protein